MNWLKAAMVSIFGGGHGPAHLDQLEVGLELSQTSPLELRLRVHNPGPAVARFCRWHTPIEGFAADFLVVEPPGGPPLPYQGVLAKRGAPGPEDFLTLKPGESAEAVFGLVEGYGPLPAGPLTVRFKGSPGVNGLPDSAPLTLP